MPSQGGTAWEGELVVCEKPEGRFHPALGDLIAACDALGVDLQQDLDAVARPGGDERGIDTGVEPGGDDGVAQVIRAAGKRRSGLRWRQRGQPGGLAELRSFSWLKPTPVPSRRGGQKPSDRWVCRSYRGQRGLQDATLEVVQSGSDHHEHEYRASAAADGDLTPLEELIRQTPGAHPIRSADELCSDAFETDEELDEFLAFVADARHADLA